MSKVLQPYRELPAGIITLHSVCSARQGICVHWGILSTLGFHYELNGFCRLAPPHESWQPPVYSWYPPMYWTPPMHSWYLSMYPYTSDVLDNPDRLVIFLYMNHDISLMNLTAPSVLKIFPRCLEHTLYRVMMNQKTLCFLSFTILVAYTLFWFLCLLN